MEIVYTAVEGVPSKLYRAENAHGTVLAVHGFGGSKESGAIEGLAQRVCDKGLNVLTFDLPAHGERTEPSEELNAPRCIKEMLALEKYAKSLGGELYAFATSFGGMCMLHRLEKLPDNFKRIVLRVPAVNMSESLLTISKMTDREYSFEKAKERGFKITLGREYIIPYRCYEELLGLHCLRSSEVWNDSRIMTVYAERDELVSPADTMEFLRCNPLMMSHCVAGSGHRMSDVQHLAEALDKASEFLL